MAQHESLDVRQFHLHFVAVAEGFVFHIFKILLSTVLKIDNCWKFFVIALGFVDPLDVLQQHHQLLLQNEEEAGVLGVELLGQGLHLLVAVRAELLEVQFAVDQARLFIFLLRLGWAHYC